MCVCSSCYSRNGGIGMIEQLHEIRLHNSNGDYCGYRVPSNWELMEKINELVEEVNRLKKKLEEGVI